MELFNDKRDLSANGIKRRKKFDELINLLKKNNIDEVTARNELLKVLRGEKSEILSKINPQK